MNMKQYPNLQRYLNHFIWCDGKPEHEGCYPNLIIWIREALNDDQWAIVDYLDMDEDEQEEFGSWGTNSRWGHVVAPILSNLIGDENWKDSWLTDVLLQIAEDNGDPDVEQIYFSKKD